MHLAEGSGDGTRWQMLMEMLHIGTCHASRAVWGGEDTLLGRRIMFLADAVHGCCRSG